MKIINKHKINKHDFQPTTWLSTQNSISTRHCCCCCPWIANPPLSSVWERADPQGRERGVRDREERIKKDKKERESGWGSKKIEKGERENRKKERREREKKKSKNKILIFVITLSYGELSFHWQFTVAHLPKNLKKAPFGAYFFVGVSC